MDRLELEKPHRKTRWTRPRITGAVVLLALLLRLWAVLQLPVDFDEPVYIEAGYEYALAIRSGDLTALTEVRANIEHPPLVKILYGMLMAVPQEEPAFNDALLGARVLSALAGTLAVWLLSLVNPLAGGMLAVQTLAVKYTSQAYLEAVPHLTSLAAVLAFLQFSRSSHVQGEFLPRSRWFWLSAAALGLTAAGKYIYVLVVFVILFLAWQNSRKGFSWASLLPYFLLAGFVFWTFNPFLWNDPAGRLFESLTFHSQYAQSAHVEASGYRWYQPVIWIAHSAAYQFHPDVFLYFGFDGLIFLLALGGMPREWRERRWVVGWLAAGLLFLLIWPTKWPQYTLVLIPALCLAAAVTGEKLYRIFAEYESYYGALNEILPRPSKGFWIVIVAVSLALIAGYTANTISVARGRMGWSQLTPGSSFLPPGTVYAMLPGENGDMVLGTERGVAFWSPPAASDLPDTWVIYNSRNSSLPHDRILSLAYDSDGMLWAGTQAGASRYDGQEWQNYRSEDLGLPAAQVNALAPGSGGSMWAGTSTGAAVYKGGTWQAYPAGSGLIHEAIFAVEVQALSDGDRVWFGTLEGLSRLDTVSGEWTSYSREYFDSPRGGISDLLLDLSGQLWVASQGGGLYHWNGSTWQVFRTSNSDIPYNTVQVLAESPSGTIWAGLGIPNASGGLVARMDGDSWTAYTSRNSGFSGAEPVALAFDSTGRLWIGNRTSGIDIFQFSR